MELYLILFLQLHCKIYPCFNSTASDEVSIITDFGLHCAPPPEGGGAQLRALAVRVTVRVAVRVTIGTIIKVNSQVF